MALPSSGRRFLRDPEIRAKIGLARSTEHNLAAAGLFPKRIAFSAGVSVLFEDEVDSVMAARAGGATDDEMRQLVAAIHAAREERKTALLRDRIGAAV